MVYKNIFWNNINIYRVKPKIYFMRKVFPQTKI